MTAQTIRDHVTTATDASDGTYDIEAIVTEIGDRYGYDVDPETIPDAEYWEIVGRHATDATATYAYKIEVSDNGETWQAEDDDAIGTEVTEQTPEGLAKEILDNRLDDLGDDAPEHIRCVVWEGDQPGYIGDAAAIATR